MEFIGPVSPFPRNYDSSRKAFIARAQSLRESLGAEIGAWSIPSPREKDLFVDHIYLPATQTPKRLFVITSGVHGLEAYAGVGLQNMFLDTVLPRLDRRETSVWIVHAMNPFGFRHHTRNTENHVNLNRNCSIHPALFTIRNPQSLAMGRRFIPTTKLASLESHLISKRQDREGRVFFEDVSADELIKAVGMGQYEDIAGLEFGGFKLEEQTRQLILGLQQKMPLHRDIILFDLHTGLGETGRLHLLTGDEEGCIEPELFSELFQPADDRAVYDFTPNDVEGFYKTYGALNNIFPEIAVPGQRVAAVTLEYGTLGHSREELLDGLNRWFIEHQGCHFGYASAEIEAQVKALYLEKFFPENPAWRDQVLSTTHEFFERVFRRAGALK